jgi:hypothetical protein
LNRAPDIISIESKLLGDVKHINVMLNPLAGRAVCPGAVLWCYGRIRFIYASRRGHVPYRQNEQHVTWPRPNVLKLSVHGASLGLPSVMRSRRQVVVEKPSVQVAIH